MKDTLTTAAFKLRVDQLQQQIDSLKNAQVLDQVKYRAIEHQEVVNQVNDFYDSAWIKLLIVGSLVGFLVPYLFNLMQKRDLKNIKEKMLVEFKEEFDIKILQMDEDFKTKSNELKILIDESKLASKADMFFLRGILDFDAEYFVSAAYGFMMAAKTALLIKNPNEVFSILDNLLDAFKEIKKRSDIGDFYKLLSEVSEKIDLFEFINIIRNIEPTDELKIIIKDLEKEALRIINFEM